MGITSVKKGISTNTAAYVSGKAENKMKSGKILPITAVVLIITVTALFSACSKIDYGMSPITETSEETPTTTPPAETSPRNCIARQVRGKGVYNNPAGIFRNPSVGTGLR